MIPSTRRAKRVTKAKIGLFTATPAQLPAAGGKVRLIAVVQGATRCRFSLQRLARGSATKPCGSGNASVTVTVPRNAGGSARKFQFALTATGPHSSTTAGPAWVIQRGASASGAAPKITTQPSARTVIAGSAASFSASATGATSVRWQVSSNDGQSFVNVPGSSASTYTLTAVAADSGYEYRAVFANSHGSTDSRAATLLVTTPAPAVANAPVGPSVTLQPSSVHVATGAAVTFTAGASGSPAPSVQWQLSTDGGATWANLAGANASSYGLTARVGESGYQFRAVFTNAAGTVLSSPASLTVAGPPQGPALTAQPLSQSVLVGTSVTFTATASGSPTPGVQWFLSTDGGNSWSQIPGATSTSYTFIPNSLTQSGSQYEAVFTNATATATSAAATLTVAATISPPAVTSQSSDVTVIAGNAATFTATATGTPTPNAQWEVSTDSGGTWNPVPGGSSATNSTTLTFTATASQNGNEYEAVFTNGSGTATSNPVTLHVHTLPRITEQPASTSVSNGTLATFSAQATGLPTPTVQWMVSIDGGNSWSQVVGATSTTYAFTADQSESGYEYEAVFTNAAGSTPSAPATLIVGDDTSSTNWSGYVATGANGSFTAVTGTWIVPTATCSGSTTYSSMWIGIDGFGGSTVEQDGTDADCLGSTPTPHYHAWIELYGDDADTHLDDGNSVTLPGAVSAGDSISASVTYAGVGGWTLTIADLTPADHWTSTTTVNWDPDSSAAPLEATAEWVVERPELCAGPNDCNLSSLTNFGTAAFSTASATENGTPQSLSGLSAFPVQMSSASDLLALPGPLSGNGFSDTFYGSN